MFYLKILFLFLWLILVGRYGGKFLGSCCVYIYKKINYSNIENYFNIGIKDCMIMYIVK